jgi:hypothetical protein
MERALYELQRSLKHHFIVTQDTFHVMDVHLQVPLGTFL